MNCMSSSERFPCQVICLNAHCVRLGLDHAHRVRWFLLKEGVAILNAGESNLESARKATKDLVHIAEARVNSLHVGATWSMLSFEKPQVGSVLAVDPNTKVLVVRE